jgi:heme-degrading monooxygenase HmoA
MYGVLMKFETDNPEVTRSRAYEIKSAYEQIPGFIKITFFNDVGNAELRMVLCFN